MLRDSTLLSCTAAQGKVWCALLLTLCKLLKSSLVVVTLSLCGKTGAAKKCTARCTSPPPGRTWRHSFSGPSMVWLGTTICYKAYWQLAWFQGFLCVTNEVLCSSSSCKHKLMFCHTKSSPTHRWSNNGTCRNCPPGQVLAQTKFFMSMP